MEEEKKSNPPSADKKTAAGDKEKKNEQINPFTRFVKNKKASIPTLVVLIVLIIFLGWWLMGRNVSNSNSTMVKNTSSGEQARRYLDGVWTETENANMYPIGLMVENLATVRPQSGLDQAGLIYEALVEGGITRFLAFYTMTDPIEAIGPIRSARPYYLDWVKELDALYGHVGGSPEAMSLISPYQIFNLDQFWNARYYWRAEDRAAPHNVFTASKFLVFALRDKEASSEGKYEPWLFKEDVTLSGRPTEEKQIEIDYSSFNYKVVWKYDRDKNSYLRYQADEPHLMSNEKQIEAKNVAVQYVKTSLADESRLSMETIGEGDSIVFQDGEAKVGRWKKSEREERTRFYDANNKEIEFDAGPTWVQVVPTDREVSYN
jgi:hypothetical protein